MFLGLRKCEGCGLSLAENKPLVMLVLFFSHMCFVVGWVDLFVGLDVSLRRQLVKSIVFRDDGRILHPRHLLFDCLLGARVFLDNSSFFDKGLLQLGGFGVEAIVKSHLLSEFGMLVHAKRKRGNERGTFQETDLFIKASAIGTIRQTNLPKLEPKRHNPQSGHLLRKLHKD